jgi:hypothetical protein
MFGLFGLSRFQNSSPAGVYDAFISYSHARDRHVAAALQRAIQTLGKPWYKRRALWVFRDDTSLSAAPGLWGAIEQALSKSRYLILLASPEARDSVWVGREVEYWLKHKSADTLLIALTGSDLAWDAHARDFRWSSATPLPPMLKARIREEPKWVDLRSFRDKRTLQRQRSRKFANLTADLAAAIHGMPKEDLLTEEIRQKKWDLRLVSALAAMLLAVAATAAWLWKAEVADRNIVQARFERAIEIMHRLAGEGKLTPDDANWVRLMEREQGIGR